MKSQTQRASNTHLHSPPDEFSVIKNVYSTLS